MRRVITATVALLLAAGISPASADYGKDSSACTRNDPDRWRQNLLNDNGVTPVRTGPGREYKVKGRLGALALVRIHCSTLSRSGERWYYGKASLDSNGTRQIMGWVWSGNLTS